MKSEIRSIKIPSIVKRILAMIMDGILLFFTWGCLVAWVMVPISNKAFHYEETQAKALRYEVFSGLYIIKEKGSGDSVKTVEINEFSKIDEDSQIDIIPLYNMDETDPEFYRAHIKYYYLNFKTNQNINYDPEITDEEIKNTYYSPLFNEDIVVDSLGIKPNLFYTEAWFEDNFGSSKLTTLDELKNASYDAVSDFFNSSFFQELNNSIKKTQLFIIFPPYLLSFGIYFVLIPLCFKNGETLSKKFFKLALVTKDGYDIKKRQIVFRQILLLLYLSLFLFGLGIGLTSIATLGVGVLIYVITILISKQKRSVIDLAAYTYLIDANTSVWFHDEKVEEEKQHEYEMKMQKYQNVEVENKNLIQVGSTIIDEEIKKEVEEANKNN